MSTPFGSAPEVKPAARKYCQDLPWGETHDPVHGNFKFINSMNVPNLGQLIFLVPATDPFMF